MSAEDYSNIIVLYQNSDVARLRDVANVIDDVENVSLD